MKLDNNMTLDDAVPRKSKFLTKEDCEPPILVTISHMSIEEIEGDHGPEQRTVLHFDGDEIKPLVLNQTNKELLKAATGAEKVGDVKHKQIVLFNDPNIMFAGKKTGGIRLRGPRKQPVPEYDDDIPF